MDFEETSQVQLVAHEDDQQSRVSKEKVIHLQVGATMQQVAAMRSSPQCGRATKQHGFNATLRKREQERCTRTLACKELIEM